MWQCGLALFEVPRSQSVGIKDVKLAPVRPKQSVRFLRGKGKECIKILRYNFNGKRKERGKKYTMIFTRIMI